MGMCLAAAQGLIIVNRGLKVCKGRKNDNLDHVSHQVQLPHLTAPAATPDKEDNFGGMLATRPDLLITLCISTISRTRLAYNAHTSHQEPHQLNGDFGSII